MLRQAAAVLVSLPALLASKLDSAALLALLGERLAVARAPDPALGKLIGHLVARSILVIIDGTAAVLLLDFCLIGEARGRGRKAAD